MSHPLMPLIVELSSVVGEPHGRWVHWGATTQNITQTGDVLMLRDAYNAQLGLLGNLLGAAAELAERGAGMVMAGRTHGQHAVPVTFGFKVATWIDELTRHVTRMRELDGRLFVAIVGGAVGNFASFGEEGPDVQARVAARLGLRPMAVPARCIADHFAEYVCVLALLAATGGRIGREVFTLMKTDFGEVREPTPPGAVGSSTMPHKRNPQLSQDVVAIAAQVRSLVPLALEAMNHEHEVDSAFTDMMYDAVSRACVLVGDMMVRLAAVLGGLELDEDRMRANLDLTDGLITSEAVMLSLGAVHGRQRAHEIVSDAAQAALAGGRRFADVLADDTEVASYLDRAALAGLLDPARSVGLSSRIASAAADRARQLAKELSISGGSAT